MKKINYRKCIACGKMLPKSDLIKITKECRTNEIVIDPDNKTFGRSVYICKNNLCVENAFKKGKFFKILKIKNVENLDKKIKAVLN